MADVISSLAKYILISPNKTQRYKKLSKVTPHHMAAVLSIESCATMFAQPSRNASSNYVIGNDGRVGCCVPENYAAWTSSSSANDQEAITIEVSNSSTGGDWPISNAAWRSLVELCVDICKRNGIKSLEWDGSPNGSLTAHYMFSATACPGPYMKYWMATLADEVNNKLAGTKGKWHQDKKGWWYKYPGGGYPKNQWLELDAWYCFDSEGYAVTGWKKINGKWYYFDKNCRMQTGWVITDGKWSYLATDGHMVTGWQKWKGDWYYLDKNGYMVEDQLISLPEGRFYLHPGGKMAKSEVVKIGDRFYAFDVHGYNVDPTIAGDGSLIL